MNDHGHRGSRLRWDRPRRRLRGAWRPLLVGALMLAQAACATYSARPLDPAASRAQLEARSLTDPALGERLKALLPADRSVPPAGGWGAAELLVAAAQFNPRLAEARARLAAAVAGVTTARAIPNPNLTGSFEYDLHKAAEATWLWAASSMFIVDTPLRRRLRMELAQSAVQAARADYAETLWGVRRELRAARLAAHLAERRLTVLAAAERDRSELAAHIARRVAAGESAASERLQNDVELARTRSAQAEAARQRAAARAHLAAVIGVPQPALEAVPLNFDDLTGPAPLEAARVGELREHALLSRADLERAADDYQASEVELQQAVRAQYPQLTVGPGYMFDHGIRKATLGVSFDLPVFNQNQGPIAEARARREAAGQHLLGVQSDILSEVDAARTDYALALGALGTAEGQRGAAEALARSVERAFTAGAEDRPALLAARLAAAAEALAELDALERAAQALGALEDALRTPLAGNETMLRLNTDLGEP